MWLEHRLKLNVAAFYIDWKNIQLTRRGTISTFTDNAGDAVSKGVDVELEAAPLEWLSFGVSPAYTDAQLTSVLPGVPVLPGPLHGSPKWTVSDFVQVTKAFDSGVNAFLRVDHRYVGAKDTILEAVAYAAAGRSDPYHLINLRIGASFNNYEVNAFVNNLTNDDAGLASRISANTFFGRRMPLPTTASS